MLEIINNLAPFFEDSYRRISVREYSRLIKVSPPKASSSLSYFKKEGLLISENDRNYIFYSADKKSRKFLSLSKIYWEERLKGVLEYIEEILISPCIVLFGSLSKAEAKRDSDADLCVFSSSKKKLDLSNFEKKLKRNIQLFSFDSLGDIKNKELVNNIFNGFVLKGRIKL